MVARGDKMPTLISKPTRVEAAGNKPKRIDAYIGRVNSGHGEVSGAHMRSPGGWVEPGQTPAFSTSVRARRWWRTPASGSNTAPPNRPGRSTPPCACPPSPWRP
jgi:hypothetical protein